MTTKQQEFRRLLNLTIEGDEELAQAFRDGADAVESLWSDDCINDLAKDSGGNSEDNHAWVERVISARDAVIEEMSNQ